MFQMPNLQHNGSQRDLCELYQNVSSRTRCWIYSTWSILLRLWSRNIAQSVPTAGRVYPGYRHSLLQCGTDWVAHTNGQLISFLPTNQFDPFALFKCTLPRKTRTRFDYFVRLAHISHILSFIHPSNATTFSFSFLLNCFHYLKSQHPFTSNHHHSSVVCSFRHPRIQTLYPMDTLQFSHFGTFTFFNRLRSNINLFF